MFLILKNFYEKYFSHPQAVLLFLFLFFGFSFFFLFGQILTPVLASIVISYLLDWLVVKLENMKIPRAYAIAIVYSVFMGLLILTFVGIVPLLWRQVSNLVADVPSMSQTIQASIIQVIDEYPQFFTEQQLQNLLQSLQVEVQALGKSVLSYSLSSIPGFLTWLVYLVLMPMLVFFFLKDRDPMLNLCSSFLPKDHSVLAEVWDEVDSQIGNYVRGKVTEILIVGGASFFTFQLLNLRYSLLLGTAVGLSVVIPFVGATVVTIPVLLVAYIQWGLSTDFWIIVTAYTVIQLIDGNILVPVLFSEAVNLHPVGIILAILFFGGLGGFWGVFFAIPLATFFRAVLRAWPAV